MPNDGSATACNCYAIVELADALVAVDMSNTDGSEHGDSLVIHLTGSQASKASPKKTLVPIDNVIEISSDSEDDLIILDVRDTHTSIFGSRGAGASQESPPVFNKGKPRERSPLKQFPSADSAARPGGSRDTASDPSTPRGRPLPVPLERDEYAAGTPSGIHPGISRAQQQSVTATPHNSPNGRNGRLTKKQQEEAVQAQRHDFAVEWFDLLNGEVFGGELTGVRLYWNKKLTSTAGRAEYKRDSDGRVEMSIELATKILDSECRIRNTVCHEMCHLACWAIDRKRDEQHGQFFKAWCLKVKAIHPEVDISTRHSYEINYPFNWQCTNCNMKYGRFSKSLNVDTHGCGAATCAGARLVPLFATRSRRTNINHTTSRLAALSSRDSPQPRSPSQTKLKKAPAPVVIVHDSDSDSDIEILTTKLASTSIRPS